jgi:hypothetical protein
MAAAIEVRHDEAHRCFEAVVDGHRCVADYTLADGVMWMTHTGVPSVVGGRGIAAELVRAALAHARARGFKVQPSCSYVRVYMQRHPQTLDLLA